MTVLLYLIVPVLLAGILIGFNVWRNRRPTSLEAGMREFQEGLNALDPQKSTARRRSVPRSPDRK
jgi:hypothetical protein